MSSDETFLIRFLSINIQREKVGREFSTCCELRVFWAVLGPLRIAVSIKPSRLGMDEIVYKNC